jgi:hypothetical protein
MQVARFLNRPSTIWTVTESDTEDEYGNPVAAEPTDTAVDCYFAPWSDEASVTEGRVDRATTTDEWLYVVPAGTALESIDYIEIDGETGTFEVVGEPTNDWNPLTASASHISARLRRTQR